MSRSWRLLSAAVAALLLASCGEDEEPPPAGATPSITLTAPAANAAVDLGVDADKSVNVAFTVANFTLMAPGTCAGAAGCGHVHLTIDGSACDETGKPYNNAGAASPLPARFALCGTATGAHTIKLSLHNDDHSAVAGAAAPQISVTTAVAVQPTVVSVTLYGSQQVPAVTTTASATAQFTISPTLDQVDYSLTVTGLAAITGAHIHSGAAGENGAILLPLSAAATISGPITGSVTAANITGVTMSQLVAAIMSGGTYVNVHSAANPTGELRAQLGPVTLTAALTNAQEVPPTPDLGVIGTFSMQFNADQTAFSWSLNVASLGRDLTGAHIHTGAAGRSGGIILPLLGATAIGTGEFSGTLTAASFTASGAIDTYAKAVNAILSGNAYANVHTSVNPSGEMRGQIGPSQLNATLSAGQETPAVNAASSGSAWVRVNADQTKLTYKLTSTIVAATGAHIHSAATGISGSIIFPFFNGAGDASTVEGTLTSANFTARGTVDTFAKAVVAMLEGKTYANVHSAANGSGEIRGQLGAVHLAAAPLTGGQQTLPASTSHTGSAWVRLSGDQSAITYRLNSSISDSVGAHIHAGLPGLSGEVIFALVTTGDAQTSTGTKTAADFVGTTAPVDTYPKAVAALLEGRTYVNVYTANYQQGEIRGQIGAAQLNTLMLTGGQEVPATSSTHSGAAWVRFSGDQTSISYRLTSTISAATVAHIHLGDAGTSGSPIYNILTIAGDASTQTGTWTAASFIPRGNVDTYAKSLAAMLTGRTYFNVHTTANPSGDIRGQLGPVAMFAGLDGAQAGTNSTAQAGGGFRFSGDQSVIGYAIQAIVNPVTVSTGVHIHLGAPGVAGNIIFPILVSGDASNLLGILTALNFTLQAGADTYAKAVASMLEGKTYVNVHTSANSGGEIRGQIIPQPIQ